MSKKQTSILPIRHFDRLYHLVKSIFRKKDIHVSIIEKKL